MSERSERFHVGDRVRIEASTTAGEIVVSEGPVGTVGVRVSGSKAAEFRIEHRGDVVLVVPERGMRRWLGGADIDLEVPPAASLELAATSGDVTVNAPAAELTVSVASGDVRVGRVMRSAQLKSASGDVYVDDVGERLDVASASGTVRIGVVGRDLSVQTASGDVYVDRIGETATFRSASGDVAVAHFDGTDLRVTSLSGDVRIGLPPKRLLDVDLQTLSGDLRNRLPAGDGSPPERSVALQLKTVSGDVTLEGA